jgi:hypothetical protein
MHYIMKHCLLYLLLMIGFTEVQGEQKDSLSHQAVMKNAPPKDAAAAPTICDSVNYVFTSAADDFQKIRGQLEKNGYSYISNYNIPGAISTNIYPGPPYAHLTCHYQRCFNYDTAWTAYNGLVANLGVCLKKGPVKELSNKYYTDGYRMYTYHIDAVKEGNDERLKKWMVQIMFDPSHDMIGGKYYWDLYILIRPLGTAEE